MKKALPLTLVLIGAALLITAVVFWIDSNTSVEPESFGKSLRDWITLIAGLGASIKGWMDFFKPDKPTLPTTKIDVKGGNLQISTSDHARNIQTQTYIENQTVQQSPELRTPKSLNQLPAPPLDFIGREKELALLHQNIENGVLISGVQGMGGIGKTALGLKLAEQIAPEYPDGQIYLDLRGAHEQIPLTLEQVMAHVIRSFHPEAALPIDFGELGAMYRSTLNFKKALLFYDNARDENQLRSLLPPKSCVLFVTSRQYFTLPGLETVDLETLAPKDAIDLIQEITPSVGDMDAETLAQQCGYLPLAIRAAVSVLPLRPDWSSAELIKRLNDNRARLGLVESSLSLSYDALSRDLQISLRQLGVFATPFDKDAIMSIWNLENVTDADEIIGQLLKTSLLSFDKMTMQYYFHDLTVLFLGEKFLNDQKSNEILVQYTRSYLALFEDFVEALNQLESVIKSLQSIFAEVIDKWESEFKSGRGISELESNDRFEMFNYLVGARESLRLLFAKMEKIMALGRRDIVAIGGKFYAMNSIRPPLSWEAYIALPKELVALRFYLFPVASELESMNIELIDKNSPYADPVLSYRLYSLGDEFNKIIEQVKTKYSEYTDKAS